MKLPIFQIDAFTNRLYGGNPAAVIVLERWLPDDVLQAVAAENNLAETAFVIAQEDPALLRWFTPTVEVDLCGHANVVCDRDCSHLHAGIAIAEDAFAKIHRIGAH